MKKTDPTTCHGFSLLELIISLALFTTVITVLLSLLTAGLANQSDTHHQLIASIAAESILADLKTSGQLRSISEPIDLQSTTPGTEKYFTLDDTGNTLHIIDSSTYQNGANSGAFITAIHSIYNTPEHPKLTLLEIKIEWPAQAPQQARKNENFTTLINPCH